MSALNLGIGVGAVLVEYSSITSIFLMVHGLVCHCCTRMVAAINIKTGQKQEV